jgi:hypothetical protein
MSQFPDPSRQGLARPGGTFPILARFGSIDSNGKATGSGLPTADAGHWRRRW